MTNPLFTALVAAGVDVDLIHTRPDGVVYVDSRIAVGDDGEEEQGTTWYTAAYLDGETQIVAGTDIDEVARAVASALVNPVRSVEA